MAMIINMLGNGGGTLAYKTAFLNLVNNTGAIMNIDAMEIVTTNEEVAVTYNITWAVAKNASRKLAVPMDRQGYSSDVNTFSCRWRGMLRVRKSVATEPTKVAVTANVGTVYLLRDEEHDASTTYAFLLVYNGNSITELPTITVSITK